jgi:hypothetical protein
MRSNASVDAASSGAVQQRDECFGPFPMACGPFFALGRGLVDAVLAPESRVGLERDLTLLRSLPPTAPKVLDDVWMGSLLWRLVGGTAPVALFTINPRGPLYSDAATRFRAQPSVVVWHNRLKYVQRIRVMYAYHMARGEAHHCRAHVTWRKLKAHCCGSANQRGLAARGRGSSSAEHPGHAWPLWFAHADTSACVRPRTNSSSGWDLSVTSRWAPLGLSLDPRSVSLVEQA